ncbi:UNVERIFIED_ORG: DNA-binding transcriptional LysR family regulator [Martelella mediterranea]
MSNNPHLPALDGLSVFLAVSRGGGFRTAARWLGVAPSTVSETISRLESSLGVPLLIRTTRNVALTEAGRALAERLEPVMSEARSALADAASSSGSVRGALKLNVPGAVMSDILPPLIDRFLKRHPDVRLEIIVDDRLTDTLAAGFDAGIRYGEHLAQDMIAVPIGPRRQWGALAASPAYLKMHPAPEHPRDVLDHACIRTRFASGALAEWEFERGEEVVRVDPAASIAIGTSAWQAAIDLAIAGHGLVFAFGNWLEPHFASGALVPLLPDWWPEFDGPFLYYSSRLTPRPLRAFIDLVAEDRRARGTDEKPNSA